MYSKLQDERLALWDRLLMGELLDADALERELGPLIRSLGDEERENCVLLLAAAAVLVRSRSTARHTLAAALRYWWSKTGSKNRPPRFDPRMLKHAGVLEVMGLDLTWEEALRSVGIVKRSVDHKSLHRVVEQLERAYGQVWERLLARAAPAREG